MNQVLGLQNITKYLDLQEVAYATSFQYQLQQDDYISRHQQQSG